VMRSCQKRRNQIHQDSLWNSRFVHKNIWILVFRIFHCSCNM
jgi:hypothetical protein